MVAYVIAVVPIVWVSRSIIIYRIVLSNFIFSFRNKLILILILILLIIKLLNKDENISEIANKVFDQTFCMFLSTLKNKVITSYNDKCILTRIIVFRVREWL